MKTEEPKTVPFTEIDALAVVIGSFDGYRPADLPMSYVQMAEKIAGGLKGLGFGIVKEPPA